MENLYSARAIELEIESKDPERKPICLLHLSRSLSKAREIIRMTRVIINLFFTLFLSVLLFTFLPISLSPTHLPHLPLLPTRSPLLVVAEWWF